MARSGGEGCPNLWKPLHNSICLIWDRNTIPRPRLQVRPTRTAPPPSNVDKTLVAVMGPLAQGPRPRRPLASARDAPFPKEARGEGRGHRRAGRRSERGMGKRPLHGD